MTEARQRGAGPRHGKTAGEVSDLDKRIIEHLQQDGRKPFTQIAADLGVSEAAVRARTNRLIERGIMQVVGVTDPLKLGFQQWAMIGIRCEASRLLEVAEEMAEALLAYAREGIGHVQLVLDPITEATVDALAPVLERLDRG